MINELELSDKISQILIKSRTQADVSQTYMAKAMNKSKNTISNWESGIGSPNLICLFKWFDVLGLNPYKYLLELSIEMDIVNNSDDAYLKNYFTSIATDYEKSQLAFDVSNTTGSIWQEQLNMMTINNCCSLRSRVNLAQTVIDNYRMEQAHGLLCNTDQSIVDLDSLESSVRKGREAVLNKKYGYS